MVVAVRCMADKATRRARTVKADCLTNSVCSFANAWQEQVADRSIDSEQAPGQPYPQQ